MSLWQKLLLSIAMFAAPLGATTLTGTLNGPNGVGITGTLYMSLSQQAALLSTGGCGGPVQVVPGTLGPMAGFSVAIKVVSGALQGTPTVYGNDCLAPGGTYYNIALVDANGNTYYTDKWQITGSSVDVGTIVSVVISGTTQTLGTTGYVSSVPSATQTITQPVSTYLGVNTFAVTGTLTLPDGSQCTTSGCFAFSNVVQLTGNQTVAGNKTFTGATVFTGVVTMTQPLTGLRVYGSSSGSAPILDVTQAGTGPGIEISSGANNPGVLAISYTAGTASVPGIGAVSGYSNGAFGSGVYGFAGSGYGVYGDGTSGAIGVLGATTTSYGIWGQATNVSGVGVYAQNTGGGLAAEIAGTIQFDGNIQLVGGTAAVTSTTCTQWTKGLCTHN